MSALVLPLMGVGMGMSIGGQLQQGREAEAIGKRRAQILEENARISRLADVEQAKIMEEEGRRLTEKQKSLYAAGGVRMNVGAPLVVEAETNAALAKDKGFMLQQGMARANLMRSQAELERWMGKKAKRDSIWGAVGTGLTGLASMGMMGYKMGMFSGGSGSGGSAGWTQGQPGVGMLRND